MSEWLERLWPLLLSLREWVWDSNPTGVWPVCRHSTPQHFAHPVFYHTLLLDLVPVLWQAHSNPRLQDYITNPNYKITTTANSLDFLKEFLCSSFGRVYLSNQCHLLQTISWEVPVLQIYSKQFSQFCRKLGHKFCSSFKPVVPEELSLQQAEK